MNTTVINKTIVKPLTIEQFMQKFPQFVDVSTERQKKNGTIQIEGNNGIAIKMTNDWLAVKYGEKSTRFSIPFGESVRDFITNAYWAIHTPGTPYNKQLRFTLELGYLAAKMPKFMREAIS